MISPHVLVVGNELATLHSLSAMLAGTSYCAEESALGAEALARIHRDPAPDLVLLDLGDGDGKGLSDRCSNCMRCGPIWRSWCSRLRMIRGEWWRRFAWARKII